MRIFALIALILIANIALAEDNTVYVLDLHYDKGTITLKEINTETGYSPDRKIQSGDYRLEVISFDDKAVYSFNFQKPRVYADKSEKLTGEIDGSVIDLEQADFTLIVPYFNDGKDIKIYEQGFEVLSTDISQFSAKKSPLTNLTFMYVGAMIIVSIIIFAFLRKKKE